MGGYKKIHEKEIEAAIRQAEEGNWSEKQIREAMQNFPEEDRDYVCRIIRESRDDEDFGNSQ